MLNQFHQLTFGKGTQNDNSDWDEDACSDVSGLQGTVSIILTSVL